MSEVTVLLADEPSRQRIVDAVYEWEVAIGALRGQRDIARRSGPAIDAELQSEGRMLGDALRYSGHFTAGEAERGARWLADIAAGGHEYGLWLRIRSVELSQQWSTRVRGGDIPENWRPGRFPDAGLLLDNGFSSAPGPNIPRTRVEFDKMLADLAAEVSAGPLTPEQEHDWRNVVQRSAEQYRALVRERRVELNAGQTYRTSVLLSMLSRQERVLDTRGEPVAPQEMIDNDRACTEVLTARQARLITGTTSDEVAPIAMNRTEFRSIVEIIDQRIAEQYLLHGTLAQRVEFWDSMTNTLSHLQRAATIPGVLRDDAERARAAVWLQVLSDGGGLPAPAWWLIEDAADSAYVESERAAGTLSRLNGSRHSYLLSVVHDLGFHATRSRAVDPDRPLPTALVVEAKQVLGAARDSLSAADDINHVRQLQNVVEVVDSLLGDGDPRYLAERVQDERLMQAWRENELSDSDWVALTARPGAFPDAPGLVAHRDSEGPTMSREDVLSTFDRRDGALPATLADQVARTFRAPDPAFLAVEKAHGERVLSAIQSGLLDSALSARALICGRSGEYDSWLDGLNRSEGNDSWFDNVHGYDLASSSVASGLQAARSSAPARSASAFADGTTAHPLTDQPAQESASDSGPGVGGV